MTSLGGGCQGTIRAKLYVHPPLPGLVLPFSLLPSAAMVKSCLLDISSGN